MPPGWPIFGDTANGLTLDFGVTSAATSPDWGGDWFLIGSGAVTMTMALWASSLNRPEIGSVFESPILLKEVSGQRTPGVGLSLHSV